MTLDVGIIGAGTAGAAAALFLHAAGHRVTVYERVPEPGPVGAGIMLQPTGLAVLRALGLAERVAERGAPVERLRCETRAGRNIFDLAYADVRLGAGPPVGIGLHRGVLFEVLFAACRERGLDVRTGVAVETLRERGGRTECLSPGGEELGAHELIVVADGASSQLRDDTALRKRTAVYPWGALWFVAPDPGEQFSRARTLQQVMHGARRMLGLLPTGLGPDARNTAPLVSLFWSVRGDAVDEWRRAGLDAWKRTLREHAPVCAPLLDTVDDIDQVLFARYLDVRMRPWHDGRVVYLGDAAHAMSPQLGQGSNLALFDAMVLGDCLAPAALGAAGGLGAALAAYSRARHHHLRYYQWATRMLTPYFQSDSWLRGWLRDALMPIAQHLPLVRSAMVYSMCGVKRGVLRSSLRLPPPPG